MLDKLTPASLAIITKSKACKRWHTLGTFSKNASVFFIYLLKKQAKGKGAIKKTARRRFVVKGCCGIFQRQDR